MSEDKDPHEEFADYPRVRRQRRGTDWFAVGVAVLSMVTTLGAWAWYGGRQSERMDNFERVQEGHTKIITDLSANNARQDIALGVTAQQYADIIRRLDALDRKLDRR